MSRHGAVSRFLRQLGWSFTSKIVSAALQLVVIVLLARGLEPSQFAAVASANAVMLGVVALNGFGLIRQIQYRRSVHRDDPNLPAIFAVWQRFTNASAVLWLVGCLVLWTATGHELFAQLAPIAVWLLFEQLTTLWNGVSLVDDRAQDLMPSYLWRRGPVVVALAVALALDLDVVWTWSLSLTAGSALAYLTGLRRAEPWARRLVVARRPAGEVTFDFGYWWTEVGATLRDLDVAAVTLVSATLGGAYALPARLVRPMNLVTVAVTSVAFPRIARLRQVTQRQLVVGSLLGTAPVAGVAGVTAIAAGLLPRVVGDEYAGAVPVLRVLCLNAVVVGFGALLVAFMQARSTAANRFTGRLTLAIAVGQVSSATIAAGLGNAVDVAWAVTAVLAVGVAVLYARAAHECRLEAVSGGRAEPPGPAQRRTPPAPSASS
ncbi:lipopolysaccharide biosynthesis protein [Nocardioides dilutus]